MPTLILIIDDDSIDADTTAASRLRDGLTLDPAPESTADTTAGERDTCGETLSVAALQGLLDDLSADAVDIVGIQTRADWERGEPCPECGHRTLSVMAASEDLYDSADGTFQFISAGDAIGPALSILCPDCMTRLAHVPYQRLAV